MVYILDKLHENFELFKWLPESMRFNLSRGHVKDAMKTLQDAAAANKTTLPKGRLVTPPKVLCVISS